MESSEPPTSPEDQARHRARRAKVWLIVTYGSIALCVLAAVIVGLVRHSLLATSITLFVLGALALLGVTLWVVGVGVVRGARGSQSEWRPGSVSRSAALGDAAPDGRGWGAGATGVTCGRAGAHGWMHFRH
jgi:hypothetical protein